jgi:hypothetical protein
MLPPSDGILVAGFGKYRQEYRKNDGMQWHIVVQLGATKNPQCLAARGF